MIIRLMKKTDLPQVLDIEAVSFLLPWNESQFLYELTSNPFAYIYVATENDIVLGFVDFWITFDSGCINQIAVLTGLRHKGIATALLTDAEKRLVASGVKNLTLEVRTHNKNAIALYEKVGFAGKFVKKAYYDNGDDAVYMEKRLGL